MKSSHLNPTHDVTILLPIGACALQLPHVDGHFGDSGLATMESSLPGPSGLHLLSELQCASSSPSDSAPVGQLMDCSEPSVSDRGIGTMAVRELEAGRGSSTNSSDTLARPKKRLRCPETLKKNLAKAKRARGEKYVSPSAGKVVPERQIRPSYQERVL